MARVLVLLNGEAPDLTSGSVVGLGGPFDRVIAADMGALLADDLGLSIDLLVGDFDSLTSIDRQRFEQAGVPIEEHPQAKDQTDFDLAVEHALSFGASSVVVIGGGGGRLDHLLGNLGVLGSMALRGVSVTAWMGSAQVTMCTSRVEIRCQVGETISLLPQFGGARGVSITGARWSLERAELQLGSSQGISNEAISERLIVEVESGIVAVVRPDALPS